MSDTITREEAFLAAAAGEGGTLPTPLTREEMFLAKAAGETVTTSEPITRTEMLLDAIADGGGGGNPNRAEVITGTLENPFGDVDPAELAQALINGDADAALSFAAEGETWTLDASADEDRGWIIFYFAAQSLSVREYQSNAFANATYDYEEDHAELFVDPVVRTEGASSAADVDTETECTLTIRWHPMP